MPINPEKLTIQWYDSPEAVLREYWRGPAEAEGLDVDELLLEGEGGGLTFGGEEVTFTTAEQLEGMRRQGCWGFVNTDSGQIHAWAAPDIAPEMLMHLLGHVTGEAHPDPLQEELRAEQFGGVAAVAYHLAPQAIRAHDPIIETCHENGHRYAKLADHPMRNGSPRCPHCMAIGLDRARESAGAIIQTYHGPALNLGAR